jgi:ABC-type antimicrobial peptide transport system permease subunit
MAILLAILAAAAFLPVGRAFKLDIARILHSE